jgi:hypothetical protein
MTQPRKLSGLGIVDQKVRSRQGRSKGLFTKRAAFQEDWFSK